MSVLALLVSVALTALPASLAEAGNLPSAVILARKINLRRSDLPGGVTWQSSPSPPNTPAEVAASKRALVCAQHAVGHRERLSPDAFGLGTPSGDVTADVSSPQFSEKNSPNGLRGMSSEVIVTTASSQATADRRALAVPGALRCVATTMTQLVDKNSGVKSHVAASYLHGALAGPARGGLAVRFVVSVGSTRLIMDDWFYAVHRVEVALTFASLGAPLSHNWENAAAGRVIHRARRLTA